ncbi:hypothetical protein [Ferruginibacter profundus]
MQCAHQQACKQNCLKGYFFRSNHDIYFIQKINSKY